MLALSVKQPWADVIARGLKKIEVRWWRALPGVRQDSPIYIHTGQREDVDGDIWLRESLGLEIKMNLPLGGLIAKGILRGIEVIQSADDFNAQARDHLNPLITSVEFQSMRARKAQCMFLHLDQMEPLPEPILWRGQLGFFEVELKKEGGLKSAAQS